MTNKNYEKIKNKLHNVNVNSKKVQIKKENNSIILCAHNFEIISQKHSKENIFKKQRGHLEIILKCMLCNEKIIKRFRPMVKGENNGYKRKIIKRL